MFRNHLILYILLFTQWNAFSSDCDLTFENKDPDYILEQIEAIHLMDVETAFICFNALKFSIVDLSMSTNLPGGTQNNTETLYKNHRGENIDRIQYLMSLLSKDVGEIDAIKPDPHPILRSMEDMFLIRTTYAKINQTQSILNRSEDKSSNLKKQITKLQSQSPPPLLWNPLFNIPIPNIVIDTKPNTVEEDKQETLILDSDPKTLQQSKNRSEQTPVWTETLHIEFPSTTACRKPGNEMTQALHKSINHYEREMADFADNHLDLESLYIQIMKWFDSINNQNGHNLQNSHPLLDWVTYTTQLNQVPEFLFNDMTPEQQESFTHMIDLIRRYSWALNLYFEYRRCIPTIFREHIFLSYTAPIPFTIETDSVRAHLSDINILYEFSSHTPTFLSSFKQSYPLRILRQNNLSGRNFISNDLRNRYETNWVKEGRSNEAVPVSKWNTTLNFLENFISRNRRYLNVSF